MMLLPLSLLPSPTAASFPYHGSTFNAFVQDSYGVAGRKDPDEFFRTLDERAVKAGLPTWEDWAKGHRSKGTPEDAREAGEQVWKRIKKTITKFSLDRGFEFTNVVATNERQCYLQSIIVAGELQKAGYDAGIAMVWANRHGQTSNNGHAVALVRTKKKDLVIDCSEPYPVEVHQGLFMRRPGGGYQFVRPVYGTDGWIERYTDANGSSDKPIRFEPLDLAFLKSQFDYYRGERAIGGVIAKDKTKEGLAASERFYRKSLAECPANPLTRAMLVRTLVLEGRDAEAEAQRKEALEQYAAYGWTPDEVRRPAIAWR
ncbi:hypothetical protein EON82_18815 [bacterium]|nr:MAG: hypothetical protein EON82_18815 [bacterium]